MTELLSAAQMRSIEQAAIASGSVTGLDLMERAGQGVVTEIFRWRPALAQTRHSAAIFCGPGNNGGDGYVIARLLHHFGWAVRVYTLGPATTPDAQINRTRWEALGPVHPLDQRLFRSHPKADLYVDAVFGTGLTRAPTGELLSFFQYLGGSGGDAAYFRDRLVAVDAPSGLCLDSGRLLAGAAPVAGLTVTFECPKIGHFIAEGPATCGQLAVVDLGLAKWRGVQVPGDIIRLPQVRLLDQKPWAAPCANDIMAPALRFEKPAGHKYDHGHALILGGGPGKGGAGRLAARAALRVGAGLVTVAVPQAALAENAAQLTSIMLTPCDDSKSLETLLKDTRINALCLGPGLGLGAATRDLVRVALGANRFTVLDADALTSFAEAPETLFAMLHENCVLTPHMGEFRRLFPDIAAQLDTPPFSRIDAARAAAKRAGCTVLLKGPDTIVANPAGIVTVNAAVYDRAAPWLATAGAGDVLAGLITGLLARGCQTLFGPAQAAWLHVEAARAFGPGLIAEDLPEMIPTVLRSQSGPGALRT